MARRQRRKTAWHGKALEYVALSTGTGEISLVSSATLHATSQDPTIIRIVGKLWFTYERDTGGNVNSMRSDMNFGIYCMHEDIGTRNVVDEIAEEFWMYHGYLGHHSTHLKIGDDTIGQGTSHWGSMPDVDIIDIRSMRKAPEPCELVLAYKVSERLTETGATHKLSGFIRVLVKE